MQTPPSPGPSSSGWKSLLKLGNPSSRKLANSSSLTLDTNLYPSDTTSATPTPVTPNHTLSPGAMQPADQRSSYNSSLSTDSNSGRPSKNSSLRTPSTPSYFSQHPGEGIDTIKEGDEDGKLRGTIKADKSRSTGKPRVPQTANASQLSFIPPVSAPSSRPGPLSPKALGANATRFIRRVASAPNAKGLFSLGSRSAHGTTTKNGLLAPAEVIPAVPQSDSSLDTVSSSSSSRGRPRPTRTNSGPSIPKTKDRVINANALGDGPGKVAFRRTYSSHSIKVREVSQIMHCIYFRM
jgi:protein-serine/threonine kinase